MRRSYDGVIATSDSESATTWRVERLTSNGASGTSQHPEPWRGVGLPWRWIGSLKLEAQPQRTPPRSIEETSCGAQKTFVITCMRAPRHWIFSKPDDNPSLIQKRPWHTVTAAIDGGSSPLWCHERINS
jgi:hypothetical protein